MTMNCNPLCEKSRQTITLNWAWLGCWCLVLIGLFGCKQHADGNGASITQTESAKTIVSERELEELLDAVGKLQPQIWVNDLSRMVDSTFMNQTNLNHTVSTSDFEALKVALQSNKISYELAETIFPNLHVAALDPDYPQERKIHIQLYSFDKEKSDFKHFAIAIGQDIVSQNLLYFFHENKVIACHDIYHRYGLEIQHFRNELNETIVYYKVNFESGTGIWWHQFNFYRYENDELKPALTELQNINQQFPWNLRAFWIESTILSSNPLTFKFVFNNQFTDSLGNPMDFINDSTMVTYYFNRTTKMYEPDFKDDKLSRMKLLTYYLADNELLFVNVYYDVFKKALKSQNRLLKQAVLNYLAELKRTQNG